MKFFKNVKNLIIPKTDFEEKLKETTNKLGDSFFDKLDGIFEDRKSDALNSDLTKEQIDAVVQDYAKKNMIIAAASSAMPGPLGVVAMVFEVTSVVGNQIKMIYDIGCAYDKEDLINRDLLIDIPLHAMGIETNLDQIQNLTPAEMMESGMDQLKEKTTSLAKEIATKSVKKSAVKFLPVAGSILMAVWTKSSTKKMSDAAFYFFDKNKTLKPKKKFKPDTSITNYLHLQVLMNLMKADGENSPEEIEFLTPMIQQVNISEENRKELLANLETDKIYDIDLSAFKDYEDEKDALMNDMVILYKRDEDFHENEIKYIHEVGKQLGFKEDYIKDLLD